MLKPFFILFALLLSACTVEKPYYNYNSYTPESFLPSREVRVYNNGNNPLEKFIKIGDIVVRGGDYGFRLKKTIDMAKSAGGQAVIIRGDPTSVNYASQTMVSFVIRYVEEDTTQGTDPANGAFEEEYDVPSDR
ncbi:MAG: hypothetical protein V1913_15190 [Fibrobacterota bacterium]